MIALIVLTGLYLTVLSRFYQLRKIIPIFRKTIFNIKKKTSAGVSSYSALLCALAGTIGTGNIVGVSAAIAIGGAGACFWMWVSAFFGMMIKFYEIYLSVAFRTRGKKGEFLGGPMYFLQNGLNSKFLAVFYAFTLVLASFGMGNMAQVNSISQSLSNFIPTHVTGVIVAITVALVILGGLKRIAGFMEKFVPIMTLLYFAGTVIVIVANWSSLPEIFSGIMKSAFDLRAILGGGAFLAMKQGFSKGIFSNEAGLGSSAIIHSAADCESAEAASMWGIIEVVLDTFVICTLTAIVILSTDIVTVNNYGAMAVVECFNSTLNGLGAIVPLSLIFFAFGSIITWSFYGERGVAYLTGGRAAFLYRLLFVVVIVIGAVIPYENVLLISEVFNGLMLVPNLLGVILLSERV